MATILDGDTEVEVDVDVAGRRWLLEPAALRTALGWELRPEGLCRGDVCVPTGSRGDLTDGDGVDLAVVAALLGRAFAAEPEAGLAVLGAPLGDHERIRRSLEAPDFELPAVGGGHVALRDFAGRKRLLVAWASW
jgi:hypothetical protein